MALIVDELRTANWQRTGKKSLPKPTAISPLTSKPGRRYGHTDRSPEEVVRYLARFGPQEEEAA